MLEQRSHGRQRDPIVPFLLIDGDPVTFPVLETVATALRCHLLRASTAEDALQQLQNQQFAGILLVVTPATRERIDLAHQLQRQTAGHTPLLFVLAHDVKDFPCEDAYRLGAADCLVQPLHPDVTRAKLGVFAERFRLIAEHRQVVADLRRANQAKDQFLAMLAHELRNPLGPVLNGLHLLRLAGSDRSVADRAREMMERQIRHMARLVDDLLDVSRISRGKIQLRFERLNLVQLAATTAEDRRSLVEQAGLELVLQLPEGAVWVNGDSTRLAQVIYNLIDNAVKFSSRGKTVTVAVSSDQAKREGALTVCDQGIGIEPDLLPRVFDVFSQADHSLERERGGLGLGLALVKGLTELHNGTVEAHSAGAGQGARFVIRLPLVEPEAVSSVAATSQPTSEHRRVLVIEDNRDAADMLRMVLEIQGHEVRTAYNGPEGVRLASDWRPDVVLCDIGLPGLDGYAVARALRGDPSTARSRLIAITGYGGEENRRHALRAGFDQHLTKPVSPDQLQQAMILRGS